MEFIHVCFLHERPLVHIDPPLGTPRFDPNEVCRHCACRFCTSGDQAMPRPFAQRGWNPQLKATESRVRDTRHEPAAGLSCQWEVCVLEIQLYHRKEERGCEAQSWCSSIFGRESIVPGTTSMV